jgi:hypothetical protein
LPLQHAASEGQISYFPVPRIVDEAEGNWNAEPKPQMNDFELGGEKIRVGWMSPMPKV